MKIPQWQLDGIIQLLEAYARDKGPMVDINYMDIICAQKGWLPLRKNEEMIIHSHGKEYKITRTE